MARKKDESWVEQFISISNYGNVLVPLGRTALLKECDSQWFLKGLVREHTATLQRRIVAMGKELGAKVEVGMCFGGRHGTKPIWPYAAISMPSEDGVAMTAGYVIIPCASNYWLPWRMSTTAGVVKLPVWDGWTRLCPVKQEIEGSKGQVLQVTPDQLADRDAVRKGDAYLLNLTACPRLHYRHESMGTAVTFGQIDEVIDTVRCRLAFGMLPSA
jgi:hypothetical protein